MRGSGLMWFALNGDERITTRCGSDNCDGQPTWRFEAGGGGSNYCSGCKAKIEADNDALHFGRSFVMHYSDGYIERIDPASIYIK